MIYLNNKFNKTVAKAERGNSDELALGVIATVAGSGLLFPALWPKQHSEIRFFSGLCSAFAWALAGASFFNCWNYKKPTMADIVNNVKTKLTKTYDGKRLLAKKMGIKNWAYQPQAAQNPHNK